MSTEHALGRSARRILQALCDCLFDPGRDDRTSPADIELAEITSRSLAQLPYTTGLGLALLMHTVNFLPLLLIGRFRRFVSLPRAEQHRFTEALLNHWFRPLAMAGLAVRLITSMHYYQHPLVLEELGYTELDLIPEDVAAMDELPASAPHLAAAEG
jgi:hypothetical protein